MDVKMFGYHIDLKRAMWRRDYLEAFIARLAAWGFNTIVFEIEDKLQFRKHPAISHPDALSHDALRAVVAACMRHGMQAIPLVQSLGHAEYVLGKPEYAPLREDPESDSQYDTLSAAARETILDLFDEAIDVVQPREFFHMGGDEARRLGASPEAAAVAREKGVGYLYLQHMLPLFEHVRRRGLRPMIWADMVLRYPDVLSDLPRDVVLMDWDYWTTSERLDAIHVWGNVLGSGESMRLTWPEYQALDHTRVTQFVGPFAVDAQTRADGTFKAFYTVDLLRSLGFDVITASANRFASAKSGMPLHATHIPNCFRLTRKGLEDGAGTVVSSWAVRHGHPEVLNPATYAAAVAARGGTEYDFDEICRAFTTEYYGAPFPGFAGALIRAGRTTRLMHAEAITKARGLLRAGIDPVPGELEALRDTRVQTQAPDLDDLLAGYRMARETFVRIREQAQRNAHNLDFWIEGIDLDIFYAGFLQAAARGALKERAVGMLREIERLRDRSRPLLAQSYTPRGVEEELDQRYGFHEEYLMRIELPNGE